MDGPPPTPDDLVRWLLLHEAGAAPAPDARAAAAASIFLQLRAGLSVVVGATSFDTLWSRAMHLAHGAMHAAYAAAPTVTLPPGIPAVVLERDPLAAHEALMRSFGSFIAVLFSLVGPSLGLSLLRRIWPALLLDQPGPQTGDSTL